MLLLPIDLDDHKVSVDGRTQDVDIILRPLHIIVEYDSYRWHSTIIDRDLKKTRCLQEAGWKVIRVRENPLPQIQPGDVFVRKGQYKETCNRVLLRLQELQALETQAVSLYLSKKALQNIEECELYIADILRTRRGEVIEEGEAEG
jgi:hypothetical protein